MKARLFYQLTANPDEEALSTSHHQKRDLSKEEMKMVAASSSSSRIFSNRFSCYVFALFFTASWLTNAHLRYRPVFHSLTRTTLALLTMSSSPNHTGCEHGACRPQSQQQQQQQSVTANTRAGKNETTIGDSLHIKVEILSDTMCPWCWVGKRNLEVALKQETRYDMQAQVEWLPYFLDLDLAEEGTPVKEYYLKNYGDAKAGERMKSNLLKAGHQVGLDFTNYCQNVTHFRPTIRSHRLMEYARRHGNKENEMVEELFHMFNIQSKHLNSIEHLVEAAVQVGLDRNDVQSYLQSDQDEDEILDHAEEIKYLAEGIPTFIFTRLDREDVTPFAFSGAQPPEAFHRVFERLANLPPPDATKDSSCTVA
eukprot:scaffold2919_cov161-Amphora_coffeaeformis.AAC.2